MNILHVAAECFPLAKTGGLGDVVSALPLYCRRLGMDARVLLPAYPGTLALLGDAAAVAALTVRGHSCTVYSGHCPETPSGRLPVYLLDCPVLYDRRGNPYGDGGGAFADNAERFGVLCEAAARLTCAGLGGFKPDVLHLHDWHAGLAAACLQREAQRPPVVFTIHNLGYQGNFPYAEFERADLPPLMWDWRGLEFWGQMSFIKAGIVYCDAVTTVSPQHAREILQPQFGYGMEGALRHRAASLTGIVNGIDTLEWDPAADPHLMHRYTVETAGRSRPLNRAALRAELGMAAPERPLLAYVGRFAHQKGADFLLGAVDEILATGLDVAVLGAGDPVLELGFREAAARSSGRCAVRLGYDEALAHRYYAAADLMLVPSRYEPCGLAQMYAQRYGALPVAARTGGLVDTIVDGVTGFLFDAAGPQSVAAAVKRAKAELDNPGRAAVLRRQAMAQDFSWSNPAREYHSLYLRTMNGRPGTGPVAAGTERENAGRSDGRGVQHRLHDAAGA